MKKLGYKLSIEMEREMIEYKVYGKYALFTDPITKMGGEKFSYPIPTYEALKGITDSIYWKPTIKWVIDDVRIMKQIIYHKVGVRNLRYESPSKYLNYNTYLCEVEYQVRAHFEWNDEREDLIKDRNANKHANIARRMVERGGKRDVFLGTRECQAYVEPCKFGEGEGYYDNQTFDLETMVHGINYHPNSDKPKQIRLWNPKVEKGVIHFIKPSECTMIKEIKDKEKEVR